MKKKETVKKMLNSSEGCVVIHHLKNGTYNFSDGRSLTQSEFDKLESKHVVIDLGFGPE